MVWSMPEAASPTPLVPLRRQRDLVIERLSEHFSRDHLDVEEFERRVDSAHTATSLEALTALTADLEPLDAAAERHAVETALAHRQESEAALAARPARRSVVAVLSGAERRGQWRLPERLRVYAVFGGVELDFRDVAFPPGVSEVSVFCLAGGCEIIVPPHVHVESDGIGVLGGFETFDRIPPKVDPDEPVLRISGVAVMGGFSIETRLPGESRRDARKRRKRELKAAARRRELPTGDE
jgi:hypothetical protein